jgi:hypothetical protein
MDGIKFEPNQVVCLKSASGHEVVDYLLTKMNEDADFLVHTKRLQVVTRPKPKLRPSIGCQIQLSDFELVKVIGKGGFSKVF